MRREKFPSLFTFPEKLPPESRSANRSGNKHPILPTEKNSLEKKRADVSHNFTSHTLRKKDTIYSFVFFSYQKATCRPAGGFFTLPSLRWH